MFKKKKFLIGGIILLLAVVYLGYTGFVSSATYYYTVSEYSQLDKVPGNSTIRIGGQVAEGSVVQQGSNISFNLVEGDKSLAVTYQGAVPDTFKPGVDVVVEGKMGTGSTFEAKSILTKCASKYSPA